jgi:hypothetical protein
VKPVSLLIALAFAVVSHCSAQHAVACRGEKYRKPVDTKYLISLGVLNARALKLAKPTYPPVAAALRVRGDVSIEVVIGKTGCVIQARAMSGHLLLRSASLKAALASSFEPIYLGRRRIRVSGIIVYHFAVR